MGSKRKSKSSSGTNTQSLGDKGVAQQATMMDGAAARQGNLMSSMMGDAMPAFGELIQGAIGQSNSNPMYQMMGAMMGMPIQMETPEFIQSFIDKYKPQEPAPQPQAPAANPYNINDDMRMRLGQVAPYGQYQGGLFRGVNR